MADNDVGVREAGRQIAESGLVDDVRRGRTNRELAARGGSDDAEDRDHEPRSRKRGEDDDRQPKQRRRDPDDTRSRGEPEDDLEDEDQDRDGDYDDEDEDADASNHEDVDGDDDRNQREKLFKVKVNGKTLEVPESELIAGYSRTKDYHQKTQAVAAEKRSLTAEHAKVAQHVTKRLANMDGLLNRVRGDLIGQVDGPDMQALRQRDQTAWLAAREDVADRVRKIDAYIAFVNQEQERHHAETTHTQQMTNSAYAQQETERLMEFVPDWLEGKDGKPSGAMRLATYEFMGLVDHRMLAIAEKARRYDAMMKKGSREPQRKAKPVPKRVPPGKSSVSAGKQVRERQDTNEYRSARKKLAKTGDMRDGGAAINALLNRESRQEARRGRRFR
jgi:uncharacterized protein YecT (DUF1311 family)